MDDKDNQTMDNKQNEDINEEDIEIIEPETDEKESENDESTEEMTDEQTDDPSGESEGLGTKNIEILKNEMAQMKKEKKLAEEKTLRVQAEFDNFKKRTKKEKEAIQKYKAEDLAADILPILDNFERAFESYTSEVNEGFIEGVSMVYNQLVDALKSHSIEVIESVDKPFDPNLHHAVMQVEDDEKESNIVIEELQKGYLLKDRVIRPAMVKVNK